MIKMQKFKALESYNGVDIYLINISDENCRRYEIRRRRSVGSEGSENSETYNSERCSCAGLSRKSSDPSMTYEELLVPLFNAKDINPEDGASASYVVNVIKQSIDAATDQSIRIGSHPLRESYSEPLSPEDLSKRICYVFAHQDNPNLMGIAVTIGEWEELVTFRYEPLAYP